MVRLFLYNEEVELTDDITFAISKEFEDITNPTVIINDWSKTVSIPFTAKNNKIFGYSENQDRIITYKASTNYLSVNPSYIKKWNGSTYVDDTLVNGEIVCSLPSEYLQVGFQTSNWDYSHNNWDYSRTINYRCTNDFHEFEFVYNSTNNYRIEFSFRNLNSDANNHEVYFAAWELSNRGLIEGKTYVVSFYHRNEGSNQIIYDYSLSEKQPFIGINFNPLKKLDFRLQWDDAILMTGYAKLNEIKQTNGSGSYEITLFGELGKVFQEMRKITFDTTTNDSQYLIEGGEYVNATITKDLVKSTWQKQQQTSSTIKKIGENGYYITDIIGFAPNNSFSDGFNYSTYQFSNNGCSEFTEALENVGFKDETGIAPETAIPNGLLPREIGEYRSYLQLPYIFWNKLFQIFKAKVEEVTAYSVVLDNSWFNTSNPYWYNLVYMLKSKDIKNGITYSNSYKDLGGGYTLGYWEWSTTPTYSTPYSTPVAIRGTINEQVNVIAQVGGYNLRYMFGDYNTFYFNINFDAFLMANHEGQTISSTNQLIITISAVGQNGHTEDLVYTFTTDDVTVDGLYMNLPTIEAYFRCTKSDFGSYVTLQVSTKWALNHYPYMNTDYTPTSSGDVLIKGASSSNVKLVIEGDNWARSGAKFTLNDLWNNEYNVFDEILKYCKMFRIGIFVNNFENTITFIPLNEYFSNYKIENWTNKVDMSKDYLIKPITFENKYILFNYVDSGSKLGKNYKEKFGLNYGEYRLKTEYNFNSDTVKLFNNITPSIVSTDYVLSWSNLFDNKKIIYSFPTEMFVDNKDNDKKQVDLFGAYFFHNGISAFNTEPKLYMRDVYITDDTPYQNSNSTFFYNQDTGSTNSTKVTTYPALNILRVDKFCVFNTPKENYTYLNNYGTKSSIYSKYWENYLNERYNIQNKIITCYIDIKPTEFMNFEWNRFIMIGNQLCMINKIYDYDITSNEPTKVDLITIQDITGYTEIQ